MSTEECPICLSPVDEESTATTTRCCRKVMHTKCYIQCMNAKPECPMCRAPQEYVVVQVAVVPSAETYRRQFIRGVISTGLFGLSVATMLWAFETRK